MSPRPRSRACAVRAFASTATLASRDAALVSGVDHVIWGVTDLAFAIDRLCGRMGFALTEPPAVGTATVHIAGLPVRLVEKPHTRPVGVALRSRMLLTEAERSAVGRGLASSGIFLIASRGGGIGEQACFLIPDVVAPGDPGLLMVQPMATGSIVTGSMVTGSMLTEERRRVQPERLEPAFATRAVVQVDVATPDAVGRWGKVLGPSRNRQDEMGLQLRPAHRDGLAALLLRATDLWALEASWQKAGIYCFLADGRLVVPARQTGGLPIEVAEG